MIALGTGLTLFFVWGIAIVAPIYLPFDIPDYQQMEVTAQEYREIMDIASLHRKQGSLELEAAVNNYLLDGKLTRADVADLHSKAEAIERRFIIQYFKDGTYPFMDKVGIGRNIHGRPNPIGQTGGKDTTASPPTD